MEGGREEGRKGGRGRGVWGLLEAALLSLAIALNKPQDYCLKKPQDSLTLVLLLERAWVKTGAAVPRR